MIQMNGFKSYSYTQTDFSLMNLTAKAIGIALLKVKAERIMNDTLTKTQGNLDCCKFFNPLTSFSQVSSLRAKPCLPPVQDQAKLS